MPVETGGLTLSTTHLHVAAGHNMALPVSHEKRSNKLKQVG